MNSDELSEWIKYARRILEIDPSATLWDLLHFMYTLKTGNEFPVKDEDIDDVIALHLLGCSVSKIAKMTNISAEYVRAYLIGSGYRPWKTSLSTSPMTLALEVESGKSKREVCEKYNVTEYILDRAVEEAQVWK